MPDFRGLYFVTFIFWVSKHWNSQC